MARLNLPTDALARAAAGNPMAAAPLDLPAWAEDNAQRIARLITAQLPEGVVFACLFCTVGEGGFSTYVSSAYREDMVKALREAADNLERSLDTPRLHREAKP